MFYYDRNLVLLSIIVIVGCKFATCFATNIGADNSTNADDPHEVQKAVCTVTAGEVRASAEAVTTKTLKGVCGSAEMNLALHDLERRLYRELQEIKQLLRAISKQSFPENPKTPYNTDLFQPEIVTTSTSEPITAQPVTETTTQSQKKLVPQLKSLSTKSQLLKEKSFSYYWKLENFTQHVNDSSRNVESPIFSIKGKTLRIKASFNHLLRDFMYLHLEYASFEKRDKLKSNIVLDTGGIFKHIDDKVLFKHRISILDQNNGSNDLISQEYSSLDTGFPIPLSALLSPTYSKNNSLLIQISLYL